MQLRRGTVPNMTAGDDNPSNNNWIVSRHQILRRRNRYFECELVTQPLPIHANIATPVLLISSNSKNMVLTL